MPKDRGEISPLFYFTSLLFFYSSGLWRHNRSSGDCWFVLNARNMEGPGRLCEAHGTRYVMDIVLRKAFSRSLLPLSVEYWYWGSSFGILHRARSLCSHFATAVRRAYRLSDATIDHFFSSTHVVCRLPFFYRYGNHPRDTITSSLSTRWRKLKHSKSRISSADFDGPARSLAIPPKAEVRVNQ
ncbi:hypothetical protein Mapa_005148 [Marchantia paleacea]|nr:hypothetical protein Mapa_005148 [Marchantia paleacea]